MGRIEIEKSQIENFHKPPLPAAPAFGAVCGAFLAASTHYPGAVTGQQYRPPGCSNTNGVL
jgi:hypothetical protein